MSLRFNVSVAANAALFASGGFIVALLAENRLIGSRLSYGALSLLLLWYLWLELMRIRRRHPQRWLANPAVVSVFFTFVMGYGLTNVLYFLPAESIASLGLVPEISVAMVKHQYLVLVGALTLLVGYWSTLAARLTQPNAVVRFQRRFLPKSDVQNVLAIPVLLGISVAVRLFGMSQGLYGYGGDYTAERIAVTSAYSQYLSVASGLGKLALVLAALGHFSSDSSKRDSHWFWVALLTEVLFGFMSGMKSAVGMPIVIVGFCLYLRTGKIPKLWIALAVASILVAFAVVEPFRVVRNQDAGALTSATAIVDVLVRGIGSEGSSARRSDESDPLVLTFAARNNMSYIGSFAIEYADTHKQLPQGSPAFLGDILLAPLHALIPRFLWSSKPLGDLGLWYNQVVMGNSHFSATGMGPFAYLYFAGGYLAVGIGFYFIGVLLRWIWFAMTPWKRTAGATAYLALLSPFVVIDSSFNGLIVAIVRNTPLILILMHYVYIKEAKAVDTHSRIVACKL